MKEKKDLYVLKHSEVLPFIFNAEKNGMFLNERAEYRNDHEKNSWCGTSFANAIKRAETGCQDCASTIKDAIIPIIRKQNNWGSIYNLPNDVTGPIVDPGMLSLGIPECCIIPETTKQHILGDDGIDLVINTVVSVSVDTEVIRQRGIFMCILALIAERMEIATRIIVGYSTEGYGRRNDFAIILKDYSRPIDLPLLAFYLISPASSRRIGFSLFDSTNKTSFKDNHYYPSNTKYKTDRRTQIVLDHGYLRYEMITPESAINEAMQLLKKYKIIA